MRTTKSKKPITVVSVCVAAVACAVGAYRVRLPATPACRCQSCSDQHQRDGQVRRIPDRRRGEGGPCQAEILERLPRGCPVRMTPKRSAARLQPEHDVTASGGSSSISTAIDEYGMDNVIYLSNDISCHAGSQNSSQDGWGSWYAWNPGSAPGGTRDGSSSTRDIKKFQRNTVHHAMMSKPYDDDWL